MKYKHGDRVKILKDSNSLFMMFGLEGVIRKVEDGHIYLVEIDGVDGLFHFYEDELELVNNVEPKRFEPTRQSNSATLLTYQPKKLLVISVNKDMTTDECIEHAKKIEEHLEGEYRVLILDNKVDEHEVINIE